MPRRKNAYLSDGSDSDASASGSDDGYNSQEDGDSRAERALFEYKGNKRRKTRPGGGKAAAWEGVFGEEEESGRGLGARRGGKSGSGRTDWTKAPAFVSKSATTIDAADEGNMSKDGVSSAANQSVKKGLETPREGTGGEVEVDTSEDDEDEDAESDDDDDDEEEEDRSRKPSPRVREEEEDDDGGRQGFGRGGIGGQTSRPPIPDETPQTKGGGGRGGIGSSSRGRGGIGSIGRNAGFPPPSSVSSAANSGTSTPRGGIGSSNAPTMSNEPDPTSAPGMPRAFGRAAVGESSSSAGAGPSRSQRSFVPQSSTPTTTAKPAELTSTEAAHFRNIQSTFGAKLLANMGWAPGKGLGLNEDGRAVPVAAGKVLRGQGITKGVRTEDSKREARRKGEIVSDEEDEKPRRGKKGGHKPSAKGGRDDGPVDQSWKKQRKVKVKVEHKTYEQILAEASDATSAGVGLVIDARGGELKEVSSLSQLSLSSWTPTSDNMQLPELRHNLRLVLDVTKGDVDALAREGKSVVERRKWAVREEQLAQKRATEAADKIRRLEKIQECATRISETASKGSAARIPSLAIYEEPFTTLLSFKDEYRAMALDELVVGAIAQTLRQAFSAWDPFDSSDELLLELKRWKIAYNLPRSAEDESRSLTTNGAVGSGMVRIAGERSMTPWESLLWTLWLPKVRSKINNEWSAQSPHPAAHLIESWTPILPAFIRDNILDQLILPKVKTAVEDWSPRPSKSGKVRSLAGIVFPWLPILGDRIEEVLELAKRRIRAVLRNWVVKDGVPAELEKWRKDIYSSSEWDKLALQFIVPKLGVCLREDFTINPADQDMKPLEEWVMPWHKLLRQSVFVHLLETELFPKWLEILYVWLASPGCKADEVANWFIWWKSRFPEAILDMRGVSNALNQGLDLMNEAMRLGSSAPDKLRKPVYKPLPASKSSSSKHSKPLPSAPAAASPRPPTSGPVDPTEITFRSLVEDYATQRDLILLPMGRSHASTGKPLLRVAKSVDGKGGVTMYVGDNAVFVQVEDGTFRAVSLEDMVRRATGVGAGK